MSDATNQIEKPQRRLPDLLATAKEQADGGDVAAAIASLEEAVALEPEHVLARRRLGRLLGAEGHHDRAAALWSDLVGDAPEEAHTRLARIHEARRDTDAALSHWQALLELPGEHPGVEARIARLVTLRDRAEAAAQRREETARRQKATELLASAAEQADRGDEAAAVATLEQLLELDPEHLLARKRLGRLLSAEHPERAAALWSELVEDAPEEAHTRLARIHEARRDTDAALSHWRALLELPGERPDVEARIARLVTLRDRAEAAARRREETARRQKATELLASAAEQADRGDEAAAIAALEQLLELDPEHLLARKRLGRLLGAGHHERAAALWSGLIDESPEEAHTQLARIHEAQGDGEAAVTHWRSLLELTGDNVEAHTHLARLLDARGDGEASFDHWRTLLELPGNHLEAHAQLARLYEARGEADDAIKHWQSLLDLTGSHVEARASLARLKSVRVAEVPVAQKREGPIESSADPIGARPAAVHPERPTVLNLMILGARRSATTSLGYYLMEHPEIYHVTYQDFDAIGGLKVNYPYNSPFSALTGRDAILDTYRAVTPDRFGGKNPERLKYILNRVVYAIYFPHILFNLAEHLPDLKILMSLRNPVDALYSVYAKKHQEKRASGSFEETIMRRRNLIQDPAEIDPANVHSTISRGIYYPGIEMLYRLFPEEQIQIVRFEDLTRRTETTMRRICRFLEIDEGYEFTRLAIQRGRTEKPAPMQEETRRWLDGFFEPYNQKLFELLGWPADTWGGATA